ncbi:MAG: hypothetical protein KA163_02940 [Bacteroidia bacterium]|nr:hypothetical protein [Bacteroidia bacterium]
MKNLKKTLAICLLAVSFFSLKAQEANLLKTFINKNDIAIRSVQKYSINLNDAASEATIKELLQFQIASVKFFNSNPGKSADIAYIVRQKSTEFLSKNTKASLEYLTLSDKEKTLFSSPKQVDKISSDLTKSELQKVNSIDTKNPHLFDDLNTRIP